MNWRGKGEAIRAVLRRDGRLCRYCGKAPHANRTHTLDHVVPRSAGGTNATSNLVFACNSCNQRKLSKPAAQFIAEIRA